MFTVQNKYIQYVRIFSYFPFNKGGEKIRGEIQKIVFRYSRVQYSTKTSIYSTSKFLATFSLRKRREFFYMFSNECNIVWSIPLNKSKQKLYSLWLYKFRYIY